MNSLSVSAVFVPGGTPKYTYVPREARQLERRLAAVKTGSHKLVTVTGPTKSGKTVLTRRILPKTEAIWINGGAVAEEDDLWSMVLAELDGYSSVQREIRESEVEVPVGGIKGSIGIPGVASVELSGGKQVQKISEVTGVASIQLSKRAAAVRYLGAKPRPLVIDDFHYIPRPLQGSVIRALKPLIFDGLPVVLIAIPHRRYDAIQVEREMTGRLETIDIPPWDADELVKIAEEGFPLLNVRVSDVIVNAFAAEAYGSPHLMQEFCAALMRQHQIVQTCEATKVIDALDNSLFRSVAAGTGKVIFEKLARGPRQRSDRVARPLKEEGKVDIYQAVLLALAHLTPGLTTVTYEDLRRALRAVLSSKVPQVHEVTRVLEQMSEIVSKDEMSAPVFDWEREERRLHITDPFFAFYLKWGVKKDGP